ncbi:MAG: hypothetical protein A2Y13_04465 [Planctomycetes bacterium GWC2_45_44]|nr:MAG: hypothetical protein A2Y13_04465 [Planctomycetes bacterium GWC2_45_44]
MENNSRVTILDIARKVGCARTTVVNVLNPQQRKRYSPKTRENVLKVAEDIGYQSALMAKVIKKPLKHIGFVGSGIVGIDVPFMREILSGIEQTADEENYYLMVSRPSKEISNDLNLLTQEEAQKTKKLLNLVSSKILDGLIIDKSRFVYSQMESLYKAKVPCVFINGQVPTDSSVSSRPIYGQMYWVSIDHEHGGRVATKYLLRHGHRRIAILTPNISQYPPNYGAHMLYDRAEGYKAALKEEGIEPDSSLFLECFLTDRTTILDAVDKLLKLPQPPTALFAADDTIAVLAMNYLYRKGVRIPEDISVVGYGNLPAAFMAVPKLTTVNVPWAQMGKFGAKILISLLKGEKVNQCINILKPVLLEGASVTEQNGVNNKINQKG